MWGIPQTEEKSESMSGQEKWVSPYTLLTGLENERRQQFWVLENSIFIIPRFCPMPVPPVAPQVP